MNEVHQIVRSLRQLGHGDAIALERRREALGWDALQELEHQFQIPIRGVTNNAGVLMESVLDFDVLFYEANEQRDVPFSVPHFTYGATLSTGAASKLGISAFVTNWAQNDGTGAITGATVAINVFGMSTLSVRFDGYVHFTFQGYGMRIESDDILTVGS